MSITFDDITRKKLILVRQLFQRATLQAEAKHSYVDRILALIGFDLATETILKVVVSALDSSAVPKDKFHDIVQQADDRLGKKGLPLLPNKANIQYVHNLRNDAQHKAKYPNETDVSDCRTYTRDFLNLTVFNVWGEDFESIKLIDLIQNKTIKDLLTEAETEFQKSEYTEAVIKSISAFNTATALTKNILVGDPPSPYRSRRSRTMSEEEYRRERHREENSEKLVEAFEVTRDLLALLAFGVELQSYMKYKHITRMTYVHYFGDDVYRATMSREPYNQQEAEYVLDFVINTTVQIESFVGDIDEPFGVPRRVY